MIMSDWLEKMQSQQASVCSHLDFHTVDKLLQQMITGVSGSAHQVNRSLWHTV